MKFQHWLPLFWVFFISFCGRLLQITMILCFEESIMTPSVCVCNILVGFIIFENTFIGIFQVAVYKSAFKNIFENWGIVVFVVSMRDYNCGTRRALIPIPVHVNLAEEKLMLCKADTWQENWGGVWSGAGSVIKSVAPDKFEGMSKNWKGTKILHQVFSVRSKQLHLHLVFIHLLWFIKLDVWRLVHPLSYKWIHAHTLKQVRYINII